MGFITKKGLVALQNYKYVGGQYTWLDNKLNPFWFWLANQCPMWLAPNTLTFIGFWLIIDSYATMLWFDWCICKEIPRWTFLKAAIEIWLYMQLDAMDGKQARRTNSSSPLGQLFDHGCDAMSLFFIILCAAENANIPYDWLRILTITLLYSLFVSNCVEYHTGVLHTQAYNFGVTEAEYVVIFVNLFTSYYGQRMWHKQVKDLCFQFFIDFLTAQNLQIILDLDVMDIILYSFCTVVFCGVTLMFIKIFYKVETKMIIIQQTIPFAIIIWLAILMFQGDFYLEYAGMVILTFGILYSEIICKLIICSMTKMEFPIWHIELVPFILVCLYFWNTDNYFTSYQLDVDQKFWIFYGLSYLNIFLIIKFFKGVINQITEKLGIYCFSLKKVEYKLS